MRIPLVVSYFVLGAFITGARGVSASDKPDLPKPSAAIVNNKKIDPILSEPKKENAKTKFDISRFEKLVKNLGAESFPLRQKASSDLLSMSSNIDFLTYLLDETVKLYPLEISRRLELIQRKVLAALEKAAVEQAESPKTLEIQLQLINIMKEKRSTHVWGKLIPSALWIMINEPIPNLPEDGHNGYSDLQFHNRNLREPLSELLLSTFNKDSKDSKELKAEAENTIVSLIRNPLRDHEPFMSLHDMKIKALAEGTVSEMENGLKELKKLYSKLGLSHGHESRLAYASRASVKIILEKSVEAYSTDDPKKQTIGINNINFLQKELDYLQVGSLVRPENTALVFKRKEFLGYVTSAEELLSFMQIARFAELSVNDANYHKGYFDWISRQIDNPALQKLPDREEIQSVLKYSPIGKLYSLATNARRYPVQAEVVSPLVQTYAKLIKKYGSDPEFLKKSCKHIIDFQYFSHFYLSYPEREKLHPYLLVLFDNLAESINNIQDTKEKAYFRTRLVTALPLVSSVCSDGISLDPATKLANKFAQRVTDDYVIRLSNFYFKDQKNVDVEEFMQLTDSLLFHDSEKGAGKDFPAEIMLGFIRYNLQHLEKGFERIIETYKKSNIPAVKAVSREQLQKLYSSFHRLFNESNKAETDVGCLTRYYQTSDLINIAPQSSINLKYRRDWRRQISEIERWFQRFERPMSEIILSKL